MSPLQIPRDRFQLLCSRLCVLLSLNIVFNNSLWNTVIFQLLTNSFCLYVPVVNLLLLNFIDTNFQNIQLLANQRLFLLFSYWTQCSYLFRTLRFVHCCAASSGTPLIPMFNVGHTLLFLKTPRSL